MKKLLLFLMACIMSIGLYAQGVTTLTLDNLTNLGPCGTTFSEAGIDMMIVAGSGQDPCSGYCNYGLYDAYSLWLVPGKLQVDLSGFVAPQNVVAVEIDVVNWAPIGSAMAYVQGLSGSTLNQVFCTNYNQPETLILTNTTNASLSNLSIVGCELQITEIRIFYVSPQCAFSISAQVTDALCNSAANGEIDLTVTGAGAPFTYLWSNGATTQDITNLMAGLYSVTVSDVSGCDVMGNYQVLEPPGLELPAIITNASTQTSADGAIDVSVIGGIPPYTYSWSTGDVTEDLVNIPAGTYYLTVFDMNGCPAESFFDVFLYHRAYHQWLFYYHQRKWRSCCGWRNQ